MPFVFRGFREIAGTRVFAFEHTGTYSPATKLTVAADTNLGRKYGIQLQDWPLLCIEMLELRLDVIKLETSNLIFDETRMRSIEDARAALRRAASAKRMKMNRPVSPVLPAFATGV